MFSEHVGLWSQQKDDRIGGSESWVFFGGTDQHIIQLKKGSLFVPYFIFFIIKLT